MHPTVLQSSFALLRRSLALAFVSTVLCACGASGGDPIEIHKPWSPAAPPGSSVAAVYVEIIARDADTLLGASTPVATQVDMHETSQDGDMMKMRPLEQVNLQPGTPAVFEPGGMHMMLMGFQQALPAGAHFPLTLRFAKAGDVTVTVTVIAPGASP